MCNVKVSNIPVNLYADMDLGTIFSMLIFLVYHFPSMVNEDQDLFVLQVSKNSCCDPVTYLNTGFAVDSEYQLIVQVYEAK